MQKERLDYHHISIGQPLPFNLFNEQGHILLKFGYKLASQEQLDRLIDRGAFFEKGIFVGDKVKAAVAPETTPPSSIYMQMCELAGKFVAIFDGEAINYKEALGIARDIQKLCEIDSYASLANIQHHKIGRYSLRHSFCTAVLSEVILKKLNYPADVRNFAVAGALTMNIGMLELHDELYRQKTPLTLDQKRSLIMHPAMGINVLRGQGIDNSVWLDVVEHHHELIDGTGYSKRIQAGDLSCEAQVVSLADRYCAMISEREYRPGILPNEAMKDLFVRQASTISEIIATAFRQVVGFYPPGTMVLLANGEVATVIKYLMDTDQPMVRSLRYANGLRCPKPPKRLTNSAVFAIREVLRSDTVPDVDWSLLWSPENIDY